MPPINGRADRMPRVTPLTIGIAKEVKLLPGGEATLLNISNSGAQIEGKSRLVVGSRVSIRLQGAPVKRLDGTIVRAQVSTIHRDGSNRFFGFGGDSQLGSQSNYTLRDNHVELLTGVNFLEYFRSNRWP